MTTSFVLHEVQRPSTMPRRVVTPGSLDDALALLAEHGAHARPIAGGTDLLVEFDRGARTGVELLVDLTRIAGLDVIDLVAPADPSGTARIEIGATVTHNQIVSSTLIRDHALPLAQACWEVGSPALRNRATVVGNIVTASPANDTLSALAVLDAHVTLVSTRGARRMPLAEFHTGVRRTALADDELVVGVDIDTLGPSERAVYVKGGLRRAQAISVVHAAVRLDLVDGAIAAARVALGSVAPTVDRHPVIEAALVGRSVAVDGPDGVDGTADHVASVAHDAIEPIDDLRADAEYRRDLTATMLARAVRALATDDVPLLHEAPVCLWGTTDGHAVTGADLAADHGPDDPIAARVNGSDVAAPGADQTLLHWLRGVGADGVKEGCAEGECGACTVDLDGLAVLSCLVPATRAAGSVVTTVEGLTGADGAGSLHPVQEAFVASAAVQCGYCTPGLVMASANLLAEVDRPDAARIREALAGNLCRCTGYTSVIDAVRLAGQAVTLRPTGEAGGADT